MKWNGHYIGKIGQKDIIITSYPIKFTINLFNPPQFTFKYVQSNYCFSSTQVHVAAVNSTGVKRWESLSAWIVCHYVAPAQALCTKDSLMSINKYISLLPRLKHFTVAEHIARGRFVPTIKIRFS